MTEHHCKESVSQSTEGALTIQAQEARRIPILGPQGGRGTLHSLDGKPDRGAVVGMAHDPVQSPGQYILVLVPVPLCHSQGDRNKKLSYSSRDTLYSDVANFEAAQHTFGFTHLHTFTQPAAVMGTLTTTDIAAERL
ncbi:hypothetical protein Baya_12232 [Bagarius yarrelli]|uniref:Uncharacterized protein n=1 Tax=Bagarius yarrelli TaxID=175774 RepID=A0A556V2C4_BAGYA|nr:hypothetical protein Baya_12232 [Bagarius yarrelli]